VLHLKGETWQGGSPLLKQELRRPHYTLEKDLFWAEWNRRPAGLADVTHEPRISRALLDWFVHPAFPRKRILGELLNRCCRRAVEAGARVAHVCVPEEDRFSRDFLLLSGFEEVRCFEVREIRLEASGARPEVPPSSGNEHLRAGDEALLATIQNRAFTGTWGFCPNSPEDIRYFMRLTGSKWQDILVRREGLKVLGYIWMHPCTGKVPGTARGKWRIHMFGIDPDHQGKGWGRELLAAAVHHMKRKGAVRVELTVDRENLPAVSLYSAFGFEARARLFFYEKSLEGSGC